MIVGMAVETTVDSNDASAVTRMSANVTRRRRAGSNRGELLMEGRKVSRMRCRLPDAELVFTGCRGVHYRMPCAGSVLCFSERRRERDRARHVLSSEKLRADPIDQRRPDLRSAAFHKQLSSRGTCGRVLLHCRVHRAGAQTPRGIPRLDLAAEEDLRQDA